MFTLRELGLTTLLKPRDRLKEDTYKALCNMWKGCIQSFLYAIVIPVDTGMALASYVPLARAVRMMTHFRANISEERFKRMAPNITFTSNERGIHISGFKRHRGYTDHNGKWNPNGYKSIAQGIREGERPGVYVVDYGSINNWTFYFEFNIPVFHYMLNENGWGRGNRSAWNSLPKAMKAFETDLKLTLPKIEQALYVDMLNENGESVALGEFIR